MKSRQILVIITLIYLGVFALNACKDDKCETTVQRFEFENFEPLNFSNLDYSGEIDSEQVALNNYSLMLRFYYKSSVQHIIPQFIPSALACTPSISEFKADIIDIHIYSFGRNKTYPDKLLLDSLFYNNGVTVTNADFKNRKWNSAYNLGFNLRDQNIVSDTFQFKISIILADGRRIEQVNKPVWLVSN